MNKKSKVFVFGVDGATFDLIKPWVKEGKLPHFRKLIDEGVHGGLESSFPPITPQAWSCFLTGKNPGKHGIYHFFDLQPDSYKIRYVNASVRAGKTIPRILSDMGKSAGLLNVPMTYPPEEVNGFIISGLDSPSFSSDFTFPPEMKEEIKEMVGEYVIDLRLKGSMNHKKRDRILPEILRMEDIRAELMKKLMKKYPLDFFMTVFIGTDRVQHHYWKYMDPRHENYCAKDVKRYGNTILKVYEHADKILGEIIDLLDDDTSLIVISDHGSGLATNKVFYANKWLRENGYLVLKESAKSKSIKSKVNVFLFDIIRKSKRSLIKYLPATGKEYLLKYFTPLRENVQSFLLFSKIDWSKTEAFSDELGDGIRINMKGRAAEGIKEKGKEYEDLRNEISEKLLDLTDPATGKNVVEKVFKREELFHGRYLYKAPDLLLQFKDYEYRMRPSDSTIYDSRQGPLGKVNIESRTSGSHRSNGILILWGKRFKGGYEIKGSKIVDIAPTILHTMGLPVPDDMDGRVLADAFVEDVKVIVSKTKTVEQVSTSEKDPYSKTESAEIEKRLRGIGYLE